MVGGEDLTIGLGNVDDTSDLHKTRLVQWWRVKAEGSGFKKE